MIGSISQTFNIKNFRHEPELKTIYYRTDNGLNYAQQYDVHIPSDRIDVEFYFLNYKVFIVDHVSQDVTVAYFSVDEDDNLLLRSATAKHLKIEFNHPAVKGKYKQYLLDKQMDAIINE